MHFSHRPKSDTTGTNRKQISVTVKKGRTKTLTTGFKSNRLHGNLFVRKGQKRLPIKKAISVSAPQMVGNPQIAPQVQERMQEQFEKRLDNQVNHLLNGGK